jgi:plasmid stability protein
VRGAVARKPDRWYYARVKTTLDLPDDLMRAVKIRAVEENRRLKDTIADLLRRGLAQESGAPTTVRKRVRLPLVECAHEAQPDEEMTPERVAQVLLEEEADGHRAALR